MRIAGRSSTTTSRPLGPIVVYGGLALFAAALAVIAALRYLPRPGQPGASSQLAMADAYGLGGLGRLAGGRDTASGAPSPVERNEIVTYYGTPRTPSMGILGQHPPEEAADLLAQRADRFRAAMSATGAAARVLPALHLVYAVAQPQSHSDGLYLQYVDDRTVRQYLDLARRRGFVLILDLQIGHSSAIAEVQKIERYLEEPDVFVALDPEFALGGTTKPGDAVGSIDAADINAVQQYLGALSAAHGLPKKMLIVHQFQEEMITDAPAIQRRNDVDLVIDMDGYGPADIKQVKYLHYGAAAYAPFGGIKIFLEHDPDPLTEQQLLQLVPRPSLFVYQ